MKQIAILSITIWLFACSGLPLSNSGPTPSETESRIPPASTTRAVSPNLAPTPSESKTRIPTVPITRAVSPNPTRIPWRPAVGATWQWQLSNLPIDRSFDVEVYDVDLFDTDTPVVSALHAQGRKVICYLSAGSWEDWRPDQDQFPPELIGRAYESWAGEKWLDIRQIDRIAPLLQSRLDLCREKGFDSVEADNVDGYTNDTGFPLTETDQLQFNIWLAEQAHQRGLSIGLKNDPDQAAALEPYFDWALTEDCFAQGWCEQMLPFINAGKAVFAAEYTDTGMTLVQVCPRAKKLQFSVMLKNRELDAFRATCP